MAMYTNYCLIPNDSLFEKNGVVQIYMETSSTPVATPIDTRATPDLILRCADCAALVPSKHKERHNEFHQFLYHLSQAMGDE